MTKFIHGLLALVALAMGTLTANAAPADPFVSNAWEPGTIYKFAPDGTLSIEMEMRTAAASQCHYSMAAASANGDRDSAETARGDPIPPAPSPQKPRCYSSR
jgi:hypothetical protein